MSMKPSEVLTPDSRDGRRLSKGLNLGSLNAGATAIVVSMFIVVQRP